MSCNERGRKKKTFDVAMLYGLRYVMIMDMYNGSWKQASPVLSSFDQIKSTMNAFPVLLHLGVCCRIPNLTNKASRPSDPLPPPPSPFFPCHFAAPSLTRKFPPADIPQAGTFSARCAHLKRHACSRLVFRRLNAVCVSA